ncbi:unnamed protein product [Rhizoctonia solani]|uniref:Uncharacterized protein n=1 Tax=Rhizoctonia solani TaxID=456999 RepID=A0A8H3HI32_9AGAM|nr:unnamed protein product [Rhizoctonia solani]
MTMIGMDLIVPLLVSAGFLLLLLVSLSTPIIKAISILNIATDPYVSHMGVGISGGVRFGVWGYCAPDINAFFIWEWLKLWSRTEHCSPTQLGYNFDDIDSRVISMLGIENHRAIVSGGLMFVQILHPIACGLAFLALLFILVLRFALIFGYRPARLVPMGSVLLALAAVVATVAFTVDVTLTAFARNKVSDAADVNPNLKVQITYGVVPWMILGAMVALWVATVEACCGIFVSGRRRHEAEKESPGFLKQKRE